MTLVNICSKYDILLEKNKSNNDFIVSFVVKNDNINLINITDYSFFKLMSSVNDDILDEVKIDIEENNENRANIYFLFKPIAKDLGILNKCMAVNTVKHHYSNTVSFESTNIDYIPDDMNKYEKITCNTSKIIITIINEHTLNIKYTFNIDIHEDLPIYMQNMIGLIMKKILLKIKLFIENIKY